LGECVKLLEGRAREICDYRYRAGLKPGRIAQLLGLAPNTVSKALERLRGDLRDCIERREAGGAA
jgi:RNA polymerase sigma-70 factor (ECF subfamily)